MNKAKSHDRGLSTINRISEAVFISLTQSAGAVALEQRVWAELAAD